MMARFMEPSFCVNDFHHGQRSFINWQGSSIHLHSANRPVKLSGILSGTLPAFFLVLLAAFFILW